MLKLLGKSSPACSSLHPTQKKSKCLGLGLGTPAKFAPGPCPGKGFAYMIFARSGTSICIGSGKLGAHASHAACGCCLVGLHHLGKNPKIFRLICRATFRPCEVACALQSLGHTGFRFTQDCRPNNASSFAVGAFSVILRGTCGYLMPISQLKAVSR